MSQRTCKPSPRAPSHHHPFGRSSKVHPIPEKCADHGKGDVSQSYFTSKVDWTGGKQKPVSSTDTNSKDRNSKKKLFSRLPHVRHIKVAPAPFTELDAQQAKGDTPRPYMTDKVNWTGGSPVLVSTSSLDTNKLEQTQCQQSRKSRYFLFLASSPHKKLDQAHHQRHKESTHSSLPSTSSLDTNKPDKEQHQRSRETTTASLSSASSPDTDKSAEALPQRSKENTDVSLLSACTLDTNKPDQAENKQSRKSRFSFFGASPKTKRPDQVQLQRPKQNTDSALPSAQSPNNKPEPAQQQRPRKHRFSFFSASPKTNKSDRAQRQRSKEITDTTGRSVSSPYTTKPDQAAHKQSRKSLFSLFRRSSPSINMTEQRSEEYIIYGEEDSTSKREVAECEVKKLKRACTDVKKAIDKKFPFHYSTGYKILMKLEPELEVQDLFDEERLVHEKLLTAKINLTEARSIELTDKLVDIKNCLKFYKEVKRCISRGYSEETLLEINIPDEFKTRKQKEKFLTSEVQYFRKYKKAVEKEIRRLSDMKEMQILAKERHCYCFYCRE